MIRTQCSLQQRCSLCLYRESTIVLTYSKHLHNTNYGNTPWGA